MAAVLASLISSRTMESAWFGRCEYHSVLETATKKMFSLFFKDVVGRRIFWVFPCFLNLQKVWLGEDELKIFKTMWRSRISNFVVHCKLMSVSQCIYAMLFCFMAHSTFQTVWEWTKEWGFWPGIFKLCFWENLIFLCFLPCLFHFVYGRYFHSEYVLLHCYC